MSGIIGYQNLLENGVVTASSEAAGFPVENLYDWLATDYFKPAASGTINIDLTLSGADDADYFAFYGHDLYANGGTIKLQRWQGGVWMDCFAAVTPTDNTPRLISFTKRTSDKWRIVITCTSVFSLAVVSFGARVTTERGLYLGWTPPKYGRSTKIIDSAADGGAFLGRSIISTGIKSTVELNHASDAWMETEWLDFVSHAELKPFFFLPNPAGKPLDAVFAQTDGEIPAPSHSGYGFMSVSIPIRGMVE